jgi:hypothetical protein
MRSVIAVQLFACELVDADVWLRMVLLFAFYSSEACHKTSSSAAVRCLG